MIEPTIGRVVWFYLYVPNSGHKGPLAAHVCKVSTPSIINVMAISEGGVPRGYENVRLIQDGDEVPDDNYCEWMPYQKGQAAKTEALEAAAAKA